MVPAVICESEVVVIVAESEQLIAGVSSAATIHMQLLSSGGRHTYNIFQLTI